jgi:hypothetical protein
MAVLLGSVAVIGCSDDGGGTGGTAGTGGTGGDPFDPALCNRDARVNDETLRQECVDELEACRLVPDLQQDECIAVALATCSA